MRLAYLHYGGKMEEKEARKECWEIIVGMSGRGAAWSKKTMFKSYSYLSRHFWFC